MYSSFVGFSDQIRHSEKLFEVEGKHMQMCYSLALRVIRHLRIWEYSPQKKVLMTRLDAL